MRRANETEEQHDVRTEDYMCHVDDRVFWCGSCGEYEVSAPGQECADCCTGAGADWTGADTREEDVP